MQPAKGAGSLLCEEISPWRSGGESGDSGGGSWLGAFADSHSPFAGHTGASRKDLQVGSESESGHNGTKRRDAIRLIGAATEETVPCNEFQCPEELNCRWAEWGRWSACSRDCGGGHQKRTRVVAQMPANGGRPCWFERKEKEMGGFGGLGTAVEMGEPGDGTSAAAHMSAVEAAEIAQKLSGRERMHVVDNELVPLVDEFGQRSWGGDRSKKDGGSGSGHSSGSGSSANANPLASPNDLVSLEDDDSVQVRMCNQAPCERDLACGFAQWTPWSPCSTTCGVGEQMRRRHLVSAFYAQSGAGEVAHKSFDLGLGGGGGDSNFDLSLTEIPSKEELRRRRKRDAAGARAGEEGKDGAQSGKSEGRRLSVAAGAAAGGGGASAPKPFSSAVVAPCCWTPLLAACGAGAALGVLFVAWLRSKRRLATASRAEFSAAVSAETASTELLR